MMIKPTYILTALAIKFSKLVGQALHISFLNNDRVKVRWLKLSLSYNVR
jgi:hypothetical protein